MNISQKWDSGRFFDGGRQLQRDDGRDGFVDEQVLDEIKAVLRHKDRGKGFILSSQWLKMEIVSL